jgi:methionyl-tRNA formyltransferase
MDNNKPNIVFMGTPEFSVPVLDAIHNKFGVTAVVTIPDKPKGRGRKLQPSAVKQRAVDLGLPVLQPEKLKDESFRDELASYKPDIIVVVAFRILPPVIFNLASTGTFNIHASLLPKYRGAAPINWAIIKGEKKTGLTTFLIEEKVDTGNVLLQDEFDIPENFTAGDLHDFMMPRAAAIGIKTCEILISNDYELIKQDDSLATPAPKLFPDMSYINWTDTSQNVKNFINGFSPFPGARTNWQGKMLKILRAKVADSINLSAGEYEINKNGFFAGCEAGAIEIVELQQEGKKVADVKAFLNGYRGESKGYFD